MTKMYLRIKNTYLTFLLLLTCVYETFSCGGYELSIRKMKNCANKNTIQVKRRVSFHLDDQCNIVPKGCVKITKTVSALNATYSAAQDGFSMFKDTFDGCQLLKSTKVMDCPMQPGEICINGEIKISIAAFKDFLPMLTGEISFEVKVQHNPGQTCFRIEGLLYQKGTK